MAVARTATRRRLGEILVELGIVSDADVNVALEEQGATGRRLGDVLLDRGLVTSRQLLQALAAQFGQEFVDLDDHVIDLELTQKVPQQLARRHRAVPVWLSGDRVVIAMANPADVLALDDIRSVLGRQVHPVMAEAQQIFGILDRLGLSDTRVQEAIQAAVGASRSEETITDRVEPLATGADQSPIVQFVNLLLSKAVQERASDVHIEPTADELRVRFRVDGVLHDAMSPPKSLQAGIVSRLKVMSEIDIAERRIPQDGRMTISVGGADIDLRVVTLPTVHGEAVVLRILKNDREGVGVASLGFLPHQLAKYEEAFRRPWGAILVTGPTGSGKSTTLYATLEELRDPTRNIITIEDPVEYRIEGIKQVQVNNKAGMSFPTALRSFLRADPDVLLIGEIRDGETATIAIEASLTGHLVLSTLHTNSAAATPMRLLEMGVKPFLVTSSVTAVVAQRLARLLCDSCKKPVELTAEAVTAIGIPQEFLTEQGTLQVFQAGGCSSCGNTGYLGRFAIHEVMVMTEEIAQLILTRATSDAVERLAVQQGMTTLKADGIAKVALGMTSLEELHRVVA